MTQVTNYSILVRVMDWTCSWT